MTLFCKHSTKSQISADVYNFIAVTRRLFDLLMCYQPTMTMRLCGQVFAVGIIFLSARQLLKMHRIPNDIR